jgi:hypothetical protein
MGDQTPPILVDEDDVAPLIEDEDIVQELRNFASIIEQCKGAASVVMLEGQIFIEAADEIERLRRELAMIRMVRLSEELGLYE